ncbi:carboxypeptidase B-like [Spodoptera frugiperda]|uniref:Carboxypeptidase B-like n=2 Tax=Spodoptera frugiperda TaxID=7108 RepID=A0A9R0DQQ6_SPOFR|nr:carboxypeptidase B-like [Spodoptera frugiperda]
MTRLVICVLLCVASFVQGGHEKYEGHQLYRVSGLNEQIRKLEATLDVLAATPAARSESGKLEALVRLAPEEKEQWLHYFEKNNMVYTKIADNLAEILRKEEAGIKATKEAAKRSGKSISWDTYYRHDEINDYLDELAEEHPDLVTVINAGLSFEGRQIKYARISSTRFENLMKPVIVIDAMAHAREWVTTPVALYIIHQLVVVAPESQLTQLVDWIIIPVVNPDGYEYSIDEDRLWRKTRSTAHEGADECPGVDVNRNFDHHWGTAPDSANPCSLIYEGPSAFSEAETRVVRSAVESSLQRTSLYISLHSYGNMFLYAWGNNGSLPSNALNLHMVGINMAHAIDEKALDKADRYIVGNAANVLYYTTGTSRDWTRAVGIPLTYTLELPGYEYLFQVPATYVEQIVTETWAGIAVGAQYVLSSW